MIGGPRIDELLVRELIADRFPDWAQLRLRAVPSAGTVHAIYRLGSQMLVRLPSSHDGAVSLAKELDWLPRFGRRLPLEVPQVVATATGDNRFPHCWAVYRWIEGRPARAGSVDGDQAARALAAFLNSLQRTIAHDGPAPGPHNWNKGEPLANRDAATRAALDVLQHEIDRDAATDLWDAALAEPTWDAGGLWVHGDLLEPNLIVRDRRLAAVIDFGCLAVGDPACDVMAAWTALPAHARTTFRNALDLKDAATWTRARGWALSWALIALASYMNTNPPFADLARHTIGEVLHPNAD